MNLVFDRRTVVTGLGFALAGPALANAATGRMALTLELAARDMALRPGQPPTPAWRFGEAVPRFAQGDVVDVTVTNRMPVAVWIGWRGVDAAPDLQPFLARGPIAPGRSEIFALRLDHAGTLICDARLAPAAAALPLPVLPLVVTEREPFPVDRDEVLLIEDWRLRPDGALLPPGADDAGASPPLYTINGGGSWKREAMPGERWRLRFINGAQNTVIAVQLSGLDVRVVAIDGQPAEPFLARDGRLVMAPGTRIDAVVDTLNAGVFPLLCGNGDDAVAVGELTVGGERKRTQPLPDLNPLPSNGLPAQLQLQSALRVALRLGDKTAWSLSKPAFRVKRGRTVVVALVNGGEAAAVFRLNGHHLRLLDRLDDGWKPFWLDTLVVPARQTVRVAFAATAAGAFLLETAGARWGDRTTFGSYLVDL